MNTMNAARIHHQLTVTSHGGAGDCGQTPATLLAIASQVTHCRPVNVANGSDSATWAAWVDSGVGATIRGVALIGGSSSSRNPASEPSRGWS